MIFIRKCSWVFLVIAVSFWGCASTTQTPNSQLSINSDLLIKSNEGQTMPTDEDYFSREQLNTKEHNACSPIPPKKRKWRGILIQAPKQIIISKDHLLKKTHQITMPICAYMKTDVPTEPIHENKKIVVTDLSTGDVFTGEIVELDPSPIEPVMAPEGLGPPLDLPVATLSAVGSYFNANVMDFIKLPLKSAEYSVFVEYRGLKSNAVIMELIEKE